MNTSELLQRVNDLKAAVEQSAANHNALFGRLNEAQYLLDTACTKEAEEAREELALQKQECAQEITCEPEDLEVA